MRPLGLVSVLLAASAASGCLSAATVRTRRDIAAELGSANVGARAGASAAPEDLAAPAPADCSALAETIALRHPALRASASRAEAALARSRAEGSLPVPEAYVEAWDVPIAGGRDPAHGGTQGMYMGGVMQELPAARGRPPPPPGGPGGWPGGGSPPPPGGGGRWGAPPPAAEEARASLAERAETARALFRDVANACVDWSAAEATRASLVAHREVFRETLAGAIARYGTGGETLGRVARTESELAAVERRLVEAEAEAEAARATLAALAADLAVLPTEAPPLRDVDSPLEVERLVAAAVAARGDLQAAEARSRSAEALAEAAQAETRAPSFALRATYMQMPGETPGLGAMVSMSLPWLSQGPDARRDDAMARAAAARAETDAIGRGVRADVVRAAHRVEAARRVLEVLVTREMPAAERAVEAERTGLAAGAFDLVAWLEAAHALEEARSEATRLRSALTRALVELEASVGRPSLGADDGRTP